MLVVEFKNKWYSYLLFSTLLLIIIMSSIQLINQIRAFSIIHILLSISIVITANYSFRYFSLLVKLWAGLLMISGGMILLSSVLYLMSGTIDKISIEGNILGAIYFGVGFILYRYYPRSVLPVKK